MYIFKFDKGLATERTFNSTDFIEQVGDYRNCRANYNKLITEMSSFPDISDLEENRNFTTLEVTRDGIVFPLLGEYNYISVISLNVTETNYMLNLLLVYKDVPEAQNAD